MAHAERLQPYEGGTARDAIEKRRATCCEGGVAWEGSHAIQRERPKGLRGGENAKQGGSASRPSRVVRVDVGSGAIEGDVLSHVHADTLRDEDAGALLLMEPVLMTWAPAIWGLQNRFSPPEKNELVLSIKMGCADAVPFQPKPNTPF